MKVHPAVSNVFDQCISCGRLVPKKRAVCDGCMPHYRAFLATVENELRRRYLHWLKRNRRKTK